MSQLDLAVVGNCSYSALVDPRGRVAWACLPRFDGDPIFHSLLGGETEPRSGLFEIELDGFAAAEQHYLRNSAVLVTTLRDHNGSAVEITDFAPRFLKSGRMYRPLMLVRQLRPAAGEPRVRIRLRPSHGYGAARPATTHGSNHIRYVMPDGVMRLTTDVPISYVAEEAPFVLEQPLSLIFGPDESLSAAIAPTAREFFERTYLYWRDWTRTLSIPFEWQEAVIRAAITLKLCSFEETGAIVAAMTTSIPEAPGSGRNWDYRYCWLRDAYFVVHALNRLGDTQTMEGLLRYVTNVVADSPDGHLQPVYGITRESRLAERPAPHLPGYRGMGPVRIGNQAYEHLQNDVYGSVVLAATQSFFDERLLHGGGTKLLERLERVGEQAVKLHDQPDAGIWELRTRARIHTFSSVMCWAAGDRLARIAERLGVGDSARYWRRQADRIHAVICERAWSPARNSFVESFEGEDLDASLLLMELLGFVDARDPRYVGTVDAIERELRCGPYLFRYQAPDDFGMPATAFNICTFWYIGALTALGRREEARELFENMLARRNPAGLLSEDLDPVTGELWGNFPQTYSMVGLILCAMRLSRSWEEAF
jgi:GH15 family glucan-1,4-alpha-glucosidase